MLDMRTVVLSSIVSNALIAIFIGLLWYQHRKRYAGLSFWLADYVLQFAGLFLSLMRTVLPEVVSIVIGNTMIISGIILMLIGLERFVERPRLQLHNYLIVFVFASLVSYFTFGRPDIDIRTIIITAAVSVLTFQCGWLLVKRVDPGLRPITMSVGVVFFIYSLVGLVRIIHLSFVPIPPAESFFGAPTAQVLYILVFQMLNIALTFALILMVTRRLAREVQKEEQKYASLYGSMQEGMALNEIVSDEAGAAVDFRVLDVNPAYERIVGLKRVQIVGQKASELHVLSDPSNLDTYLEVATTRRPSTFEAYYPSIDKYLKVSAFSPEPGRFGTIFEDVTTRVRAEEALRESEEKFRNVFETSRDFTFISTIDGRLLDNNEIGRGFFGYSPAEMRNIRMRDFYANPEEREGFKESVIQKGYVENSEIRLKKKDGTVVECEITVVSRKDRNGRVIGFQGSVRDVTERKRMEQQLVQSEKLSTIGTMISGVAHELNNPLTSIIGNAQLLMKREMPEDITTKVDTIFKESKRSAGIINGLLAFARENKPQRTRTDVNAVVRASLKLREYDLKVTGIKVRLSLADDLPETLADPFQLEQVFINLINNAHDALTERGGGGTLAVTTHRENDTIVVAFEDDGPGIPPDLARKIFDPFFTTKEVGKGTGLGLSMAYGILREHGGSISVESEPERGARFVVTIPIVDAAQTIRGEAESPATSLRGTKSVLVIEDEKPLRDLLSESLAQAGFSVDVASTGDEALNLIGAKRYDGLVTDIRMPGMDGRQLYVHLKRHNPQIAEKIIFITGDTLSKETQSFLESTNGRFVEKPFNVDAVLAMLNKMLSE